MDLRHGDNYNYFKVLEISLKDPLSITSKDLLDIGLCDEKDIEKINKTFSDTKKKLLHANLFELFPSEQKIQIQNLLDIPDSILEKANLTHKDNPLYQPFIRELLLSKTQQDPTYNYSKILEISLKKRKI